MTFNEADWGRFVARSALLLGVAGLALMAIFIAVLPVDLSDPNADLVAAARNPAVYRLAALLDMLAWFGTGGARASMPSSVSSIRRVPSTLRDSLLSS